MILLASVDSPTITDWISSIAALIGVPLAFVGFIKLVIRDKDREAQIASLATIGAKLTEQVEQLSIQASESQYQSTLMLEQNKLIEKQLEIQTDAFTNSNSIEAKKLELQRQKQLAEIKPHFTFSGSAIDYLILKNKGDCAYGLTLEIIDPFKGVMSLERTSSFCRNEQFVINIQWYDSIPFNRMCYCVRLKYLDVDENKYYQEIKMIDGRCEVDNPILDE